MGQIIAGFPGIGKSYLFRNGYRFCTLSDSDFSKFSWITDSTKGKIRNPDFVSDYIAHIKSASKTHDYVFVSTHKEVLAALHAEDIAFAVVFPDKSLKSAYIDRYRNRGNDNAFLDLMTAKFEDFVSDIENTPYSKLRLLHADLSLVDALDVLPEEAEVDAGYELEIDL